MDSSDIEYYKSIGFKCGIEIHQQLDTKKLFCSCDAVIRDDEPDVVVKRKMRIVAGELGEVDRAAMHEFKKGTLIVYQAYRDTNCLVELDEEPPHDLNQEALNIALKFALMVDAELVDEIQIMRKIVIDGSNPSGFQRTALIGFNGKINTSLGEVKIDTICLEEDAARKISENNLSERETIYRVDRLGIPLIEVATDTSIKTPEHAKEVAEKIGMILRTLKVKRGIGTIRQDLNVSIKDGARVEIKGAQELNLIPDILKGEIERQKMLIEVKKNITMNRNINKNMLDDINLTNLTEIFRNTSSKIIKNAIENGGVVYGIKLKFFSGFIGTKTCSIDKKSIPRLGREISQYVKAGTGLKGLFHSDELPAYGITTEEVNAVANLLNCSEEDAFIMISGKIDIVKKGLKIAAERAKMALDKVPEETRRVSEDTTEYMRPLPGASRMYPETDIQPIAVKKEQIEEIKKELPELPEKKLERYTSMVGKELANQIIHSKSVELFDIYVKKFNVKPSIIASTIISVPKEIKKRFGIEFEFKKEYEEIFKLIQEKKISVSTIPEVLAYAAKENKSLETILKEKDLYIVSNEEIKNFIHKKISENKNLNKKQIMGLIMKEFKGRADSEEVNKILDEIL